MNKHLNDIISHVNTKYVRNSILFIISGIIIIAGIFLMGMDILSVLKAHQMFGIMFLMGGVGGLIYAYVNRTECVKDRNIAHEIKNINSRIDELEKEVKN